MKDILALVVGVFLFTVFWDSLTCFQNISPSVLRRYCMPPITSTDKVFTSTGKTVGINNNVKLLLYNGSLARVSKDITSRKRTQ